METARNRKLLEDVFAQLAVGNVRAMSDAMAGDCRWVFPGNWSWAGSWAPRSVAVDGLLRPLMGQFAGDYRSEADLILADGDRVVVQARGYATTRRGEAYHQTYCYIFRVADGLLTEVVEHCDTALVERVLDPPVRLTPKEA
jgi:ketosteroid isomerase-like protein